MSPTLKRRLLRLAVALAVLIAVPILANLYAFYGTTDFEQFVAEHPVSQEALAQRLPAGATRLTEERQWITGERDPFAEPEGEQEDGRITWTGRTTFQVVRGQEVLGSARIEARATSPDGGIRDGFGIRVTQLSSAENLRAVVVARLSDPSRVVGPDSAAQGHLDSEMILVAGDGPDEVHLVTGGDQPSMAMMTMGPWAFAGLWLKLLLPLQSPPDDGFWLHLRYGFGLTGERREGSSSSGSIDMGRYESSTYLYSFEAQVKQQVFDDPESMFSSEGSVKVERNFFGTLK